MQRFARIGTDEAPGLGADAIVSRRADHA